MVTSLVTGNAQQIKKNEEMMTKRKKLTIKRKFSMVIAIIGVRKGIGLKIVISKKYGNKK